MHLNYVEIDQPDNETSYSDFHLLTSRRMDPTKTATTKHGNNANVIADDDDDTALLSSFASMMVSSIETLGGESNWYLNHSSSQNALHQSTSSQFPCNTAASDDVDDRYSHEAKTNKIKNEASRSGSWLHRLQKNHHEQFNSDLDCLGYVQCHVYVSSIQEIPTELSVVSGKCICYIQTMWMMTDSISNTMQTGDNHSNLHTFILHHPLIVEAIESLFIPVAVIPPKNNSIPHQQLRLQIVSIGFMDAQYQNFIEPITHQELTNGRQQAILETAMVYVLNKTDQGVPLYLTDMAKLRSEPKLVHKNDATKSPPLSLSLERKAWFSFHDEKQPTESDFSPVLGITMVHYGTMNQNLRIVKDGIHQPPVLEVRYKYSDVCYSTLVRHVLTNLPSKWIVIYCSSNDERMAVRVEIAKIKSSLTANASERGQRQIAIVMIPRDSVFVPHNQSEITTATTVAADNENNSTYKAIRQTPLRFVPMTESQTVHINHLIENGQYEQVLSLLSPRQVAFLQTVIALVSSTTSSHGVPGHHHTIQDCHDVVGYPIIDAWLSTMDKQPPPTPVQRWAMHPSNNNSSRVTGLDCNNRSVSTAAELELFTL